ncbi:MAG: hypothetical protein RSB08_03245, partial [Clostridia bacterium]
MRKIKLLDTTLRDGEQSPGCSMHINEKLEIAEALEKLNIDIIEAGFPVISNGDFLAVQEVSKIIKNSEVAGLSRCIEADIDACYNALKNAVSPRLHLFIATSPTHLKYKYKLTEDEVLAHIADAIKYAKKYLSNIQFSFEDACRTPINFLAKAVQVAIKSGAKIINIPDTVGYITPSEISNIFSELKTKVNKLDTVELSVHCHDDLGMACANSLSAAMAGATQIEGTINGIGERAGNAALEEIIMNIETRKNFYGFETNVDTKSRIIDYDLYNLGEQLRTMGLLVVCDAILNRVTDNDRLGKRTHVFIDEFHVIFENEHSGKFFCSAWRRWRKRNACPTAITQNIEYVLNSDSARLMLANSEFV